MNLTSITKDLGPDSGLPNFVVQKRYIYSIFTGIHSVLINAISFLNDLSYRSCKINFLINDDTSPGWVSFRL